MWDNLSLRDKAKIIKIGVLSGIYNLQDIQNAYNKFLEGGYITKLPDRSYAVLDLDKLGNPIQTEYIGGTTKLARDKYWELAPIMRHAVDSIANRYLLNTQLLRNRLDLEGFTDEAIRETNWLLEHKDTYNPRHGSDYYYLNSEEPKSAAFNFFGLDDVYTFILEGKVHPINEKYSHKVNINEKNREVHTATGETIADNMGLMAATLKYLRDLAIKDFPNKSDKFYDDAASAYYNRGITGGRSYMKKRSYKYK